MKEDNRTKKTRSPNESIFGSGNKEAIATAEDDVKKSFEEFADYCAIEKGRLSVWKVL